MRHRNALFLWYNVFSLHREASAERQRSAAERQQSAAERQRSAAERQQSAAERQLSAAERQQSAAERSAATAQRSAATAERSAATAQRQILPSSLGWSQRGFFLLDPGKICYTYIYTLYPPNCGGRIAKCSGKKSACSGKKFSCSGKNPLHGGKFRCSSSGKNPLHGGKNSAGGGKNFHSGTAEKSTRTPHTHTARTLTRSAQRSQKPRLGQ